MTPTVLTLTQAELDRAPVLKQVCARTLTIVAAAQMLKVSERHLYRVLRRYRTEGDRGLMHRLRGGTSNRGYPKHQKTRVLELYWRSEYRDYGPTLFTEVLLKDY